jgi:hypothetical protein
VPPWDTGRRTADKYSNLSGHNRPDATDVGLRPAPMADIDLPATRSHRGDHGVVERDRLV